MMSRIIALDFGLKRIGIAMTDESNKLAFGLETANYKDIIRILKKKLTDYNVEIIVVGKPIKITREIASLNFLFFSKINFSSE